MHTFDPLRPLRAGTTVLAVLALVIVSAIALAPGASARTQHCTDHTTTTKIDADLAGPTTVSVTDTRTGDPIDVVVTITGTTFTLDSGDADLTLDDASWCLKSATLAHDGTGTSGTSGSTNKHGRTQDISYLVLYSVTTVDPTPVAPCNASTSSGGAGVTTTVHDIGVAGPTSFVFDWEAQNVPDQFEVFYEGALIHDTGVVGDAINEGTGSATLTVPAGTSTQVTVVVTGPSGTAWDYRVNCPAGTTP